MGQDTSGDGQAAKGEKRAQIGRQRAGDIDLTPVVGVREHESRGVQELPLEAGRARAGTILHVAGHRVAERAQVHADLVRAPCLELHTEQREPPRPTENGEMGDGVPRTSAMERHALAVTKVPADGSIDRALVLRQLAVDDRHVGALDLVARQRRDQRPIRLLLKTHSKCQRSF